MGHLKYDMGIRQRRKKVLLDIRQAQREKSFDSIFTSQESWNLENWKLEIQYLTYMNKKERDFRQDLQLSGLGVRILKSWKSYIGQK